MRPIKITIKGINSYISEQVVHFDKVSENKLFGIFGETGSGKTTILDCIVMALYGTSERETMANIINSHTTEAYIIFDFEMYYEGENNLYRIERFFKLQKSGIVKANAMLTNLKTKQVLADKQEDVNEKAQNIIGVGKKEFLKCIAIPQGEFDAFLCDTPINRKKTISKLFNLEHFGVALQEKLKNRKNLFTNKKVTIEEKLAIYNDISEFSLNNLELQLIDKEKQKIDTEFKLNSERTKNIILVNDYENLTKLNKAKESLQNLLDNKDKIDFTRKQVEYTNAYGNYLAVNEKYNLILKDINANNSDIISIKQELSNTETLLKQETVYKNKLIKEKETLQINLADYKTKSNEIKLIKDTIKSLETKINAHVDKSNEYDSQIEACNKTIKEYKNNIQLIYLQLDEYNTVYKHYDKILSKLNETATLDLRKNLSTKLNDITQIVKPDTLSTLPHDAELLINKVLDKINELKSEQDIIIKDIIESLDIDFKGENIITIKHDAEGKKNDVMASITKCNNELLDLNNKVNLSTTQINSIKLLKSNIVKEYKQNVAEFNKLNKKLTELPSDNEILELEYNIKSLEHDIDVKQETIDEILNLKNKMLTDIEVKNAEIEQLNNSAKEIKDVLKMFDLNKMQEEINNNKDLLLKTDAELDKAQDEIALYDNDYAYLTTLIKDLQAKIHNNNISKEDIEKSESEINIIQEELNKIISEIGAIKSNIKIQTDSLQIVKNLKLDYKEVIKQLQTIQKLQDLIANGALMEYIAEEYMYLITEFANNYVYSISKGKYLLKYDKDFFVLDNFNGGISRTVKTLSGGERFIVSLSLALGITQSIATNNNKSFNFFFIDEGFGSLSESYIDKILQSFDSLIKLNFTVGFITHVEKMKNYITNRIVVSKENNDQGSTIKEEY